MKILVTGGAGFIGSNLVRVLLNQEGVSVVNLDKLTYAGNLESLTDVADNPNYSFEKVDLCDLAATIGVFEKHQPDCVMHLAAESHVDRSIDGPGEFVQSNIVGTFNILQAALGYWKGLREGRDDCPQSSEAGKCSDSSVLDQPLSINHQSSPTKSAFRFLHVSTDEVYGSLAPDASAFSETTPYDPHSPYSASKAASDHIVRAWGDTYGVPVLVANCSNNYGPYQFPEKLIPVVILKCLRGEVIPVYGKGENIRDWLYVTDHAEALYTVVIKGRVGETYNIGGNNERQNIELVRTICQLMDQLAPVSKNHQSPVTLHHSANAMSSYEELISFVTARPGHDLRYAIDATKIRDELGWEPKEDFKSGIRKTVLWYLNNRSWWEGILDRSYQLERLGNS